VAEWFKLLVQGLMSSGGMEPFFLCQFSGRPSCLLIGQYSLPADDPARGSARYQYARRLPGECWADCFGRVCMSPQSSTAPKTTNIATTQRATSIAVGLGGGSLVLNNRVVYESLRWAGALYLCWLAFDGWRAARKPIEAVPVSPSHFIHFRRGFVTNLLTPKAAVFFIAELPEFTQGPPPARELALLVSVYVGIATLVHGLVVVPAGGLQMLFAAPQRRKMAGNIFAVLLLAIAVWLFVSGRR